MPASVSRSMSTSAALGMPPLADIGGRLNGTSTGRARMFLIASFVVMSPSGKAHLPQRTQRSQRTAETAGKLCT